jgi:hypothetical protein
MIHPGVYLVGIGAALMIGIAVVLNNADPTKAKHEIGSLGWVESDPFALASDAGVSLDVYALASMMQSEGGGSQQLRQAVGWTAKNMAASRGISIAKLLLRAGRYDKAEQAFVAHPSNGFFGPQNVGPRYASTRSAPSLVALGDADAVIGEEVPDMTQGSVQFDSPGTQDSLLGKLAGYNKTSADIAADRTKSRIEVQVPGITSTRFWRPKDA